MLLLRIDEQAVQGKNVAVEEELQTVSCGGAAETLRAFLACGTRIETLSGVPHLIRCGSDDETEETKWGKAGENRERRERQEANPKSVTTCLVFLPAIPSWLSLWSLLSPEDAKSGSDGGSDGSWSRMAGNSKSSCADPSTLTAIDSLAESPQASCSEEVFDSVEGAGGVRRFSEMRENSGGAAGKGAVRLLQTVAAVEAPYRYAAVVHFWDMADAVSFAGRMNGLCLPDRGVVKALFLSGVEVVPHGVGARIAFGVEGGVGAPYGTRDGEGFERMSRRRRRRSLSEGVAWGAQAAEAATLPGSGREESKTSWSGRAGQAHQEEGGLSCSPPRSRDRVVRVSTGGIGATSRQGGGIIGRHESKGVGAGGDAGADGNPSPFSAQGGRVDFFGRSETASPSPPWTVTTAEERKSRGGGGGSENRTISDRGKDRESGDKLEVISPLRWPGDDMVMALGGGGGNVGVRRNRPGRDIGGSRSRCAELPPCPVCFDRLDPAISGVPSARVTRGVFTTGGVLGNGRARCSHRGCTSLGKTPDRERATSAASFRPLTGGHGSSSSNKSSSRSTSFKESLEGGPDCSRPDGRTVRNENACVADELSLAMTGSSSGHESEEQGAWREEETAKEERGSPEEEDQRQVEEAEAEGGRQRSDPALNTTMWKGSTCRVCRSLNVALEGVPEELCCETCRIAHNLWICMVCGHIGCGRYTEEHANRHFRLSGHTYSLELSTGRVWDYTGDCYAHRALRGHLARSHDGRSWDGYGNQGGRSRENRDGLGARGRAGSAARGGGLHGIGVDLDGSPPLYSEGAFIDQADASSSKVAVVSREYEALVARQLQEQQRYFEDLIATAIAADAEANAPMEEALTEKELAEVTELRQAVDALSDKYEGILDSLRSDEETARRVRSENRLLALEQRAQKQEEGRLADEARQTKRQCEQQMAELEGQMQDLLFFLKAQEEVKSNPRREELVGGSVMMGEGSGRAAGGSGRPGGKETEREKLARRLKERSNSRRAGGARGTRSSR